jgi:uncharacterized protein
MSYQSRTNQIRAGARLFIASVLTVPPVCGAQGPTLSLSVGSHLIQAEIANTFDTRAKGLMHRESLPSNRGMLFIFADLSLQCMWMRNTLIPLSVAFLDKRGVILNIEDMQPKTENSHCAVAPAQYALEMNQGWFAVRGIKPGTKVTGIEKAPAPR